MPERKADIAYCVLPRYAPRLSLMVVPIGLAVFALMLGGLAIQGRVTRDSLLFTAAILCGGSLLALASWRFGYGTAASRIGMQESNPSDDGRLFREIDARRSSVKWPESRTWPWEDIVAFAKERSNSLPRSVVDGRMKKLVASIELPSDLLEPEAILGSLNMKRGMFFFMLALYALIFLTATELWIKVMIVGVTATWFVQLPIVRDKLRLGDGKVIAGLGVVENSKGQRWTVNDTMMIVQTESGDPPLTVFLTGEAGELKLHFIDEKDPDFIKLWQRWNHPSPRPELLN